MIDDPSLRAIFKAEADERLQRLDDLLLSLAKNPGDASTIEEAFREAHSLKGAARMLGLSGVQVLAHKLEDGLNLARRGGASLAPGVLVDMEVDLKAIRLRVAEAVGEASPVQAAPAPPRAAPAIPAPSPPRPGPPRAPRRPEPPSSPEVENVSEHPSLPFHIDSVRVDTRKLDTLMTYSGELVVTGTRAGRRLRQLDDLLELCETWAREDRARGNGQRWAKLEANLLELRAGQAEDGARVDRLAAAVADTVSQMRLLPLSSVFKLFPRLVRELAIEQRKEVDLVLEGGETNADKRILEEIKDPLMHMLRNAVDHGIELPDVRQRAGKPRRGTLRVRASQGSSGVSITVSDDGRGVDEAALGRVAVERGLATAEALATMTPREIRSLMFAPGLSTSRFVTDVSGRGVGLDVVRTNVERLKGAIEVDSTPGSGVTIVVRLPTSLSTTRALLVRVRGFLYGLPSHAVTRTVRVEPSEIFTVEGRRAILHRGLPTSVASLADLLELRVPPGPQEPAYCVLSTVGAEVFGVMVDELVDEQEVVLKPASGLVDRVRNVMGATILNSGDICTVLEPNELLRSMPASARGGKKRVEAAVARKRVVLLAEDSITTRAQERRILEGAGYEVVAAVDGLDAYQQLATRTFDAVVTDVEMPNMTGLELAEKIRSNTRYNELPIILVTSLASDEDKRRGLEAGANAYISKPEFDQRTLLDCLERLVG